jgi:hypothetical protein
MQPLWEIYPAAAADHRSSPAGSAHRRALQPLVRDAHGLHMDELADAQSLISRP